MPPHGARLGGEEFKTKSLLRFSCEAGYTLIGSAERTCLHNGTWSGTQPVCQGWKTLLSLLMARCSVEQVTILVLQSKKSTLFIQITLHKFIAPGSAAYKALNFP